MVKSNIDDLIEDSQALASDCRDEPSKYGKMAPDCIEQLLHYIKVMNVVYEARLIEQRASYLAQKFRHAELFELTRSHKESFRRGAKRQLLRKGELEVL